MQHVKDSLYPVLEPVHIAATYRDYLEDQDEGRGGHRIGDVEEGIVVKQDSPGGDSLVVGMIAFEDFVGFQEGIRTAEDESFVVDSCLGSVYDWCEYKVNINF